MDLYVLLTYSFHGLQEPVLYSWDQLHEQFGPEYKQVRDFRIGTRKIDSRRIDNFLAQRIAARDSNRLVAMARLLSAASTSVPGLRSAQIFGSWKLIA